MEAVVFLGEVDDLRWAGPADDFAGWVENLGDARLADRAAAAQISR